MHIPYNERRYHRGDIHPVTNLVFWQYMPEMASGEMWVTPESFKSRKEKHNLQERSINLSPERKAKRSEYDKRWYKSHKDYVITRCRIWCRNNKDKCAARERRRRARSIQHRLRCRVRGTIWAYLSRSHTTGRSSKLLGCTIDQLKSHLESKFLTGMSWDNYGNKTGCWSIDHIKPCASFDLTNGEQQKQCFNYMNLQPLWHIDNCRKGSRKEL